LRDGRAVASIGDGRPESRIVGNGREIDAEGAHETFAKILHNERVDALALNIDGVVVIAASDELAGELLAWWAKRQGGDDVEVETIHLECKCTDCRRQPASEVA
jgi:hypothetical protein